MYFKKGDRVKYIETPRIDQHVLSGVIKDLGSNDLCLVYWDELDPDYATLGTLPYCAIVHLPLLEQV